MNENKILNKNIIILYLMILLFNFKIYSQLSGNFTIPSIQYPTIDDIFNDMETVGINGPVIINISDGIYTENIIIGPISGTSSTNTITMQSASLSSSAVTIQFTPTHPATDNFVIQFSGSQYIIVQNITFKTLGTDWSRVISLTNSAGNLVFQNNIFEGYDSNFLINNFQAIVFGDDSGSLDNISFVSNIFNYGFFSIMLFPTYGYNLQINNNTFNCNYAGGIFLQSFINTNINDNIATFNIVQILYNTFINLSNNEIINNNGEGLLLFECYGNTSNFNKITNNFIQTGGTGIRLENCEYLEIYFNTINISNNPLTTQNSTSAIQLTSGNSRIKLENNILMNKRDGYAYSGESGFQNTNDFNNFFSSGSNLAKWEGSDYSTLTEFKTASSTNQNSYSTDIQFNSISDLHIKNSPVQLFGTTISGITTDIDGDTRNSPPFIGADEPETMQVSLTVLLEGPYSGTGNMSTSINGSLPLLHPYNSSIHDGTESVPLDFFTSHTDIIDWIAVELRSDISTKVSSRVGFLLANGEIVDIDGISPLIFYVDPSLNYHALIYHRNHLPVISSGFVN